MILNLIITISGAIAAISALATAIVAYRQMKQASEFAEASARETMRLTKFSAELESIRHLDKQWLSVQMIKARRVAAKALLGGKANNSLDQVLDFFEEIVRLSKRGILPIQTTYDTYYWPMANYLLGADAYIKQVTNDEGATWDDLFDLMPALKELESKRTKSTINNVSPSIKQMKEFLKDESNLLL